MNYSELQTAVEDYLENAFEATLFASMTRAAEQKIYAAIQLEPKKQTSTAVAVAQGTSSFVFPVDGVLALNSVALVNGAGTYTYLLNKDIEFIREAYPVAATQGSPKHYALNGVDAATQRFNIVIGPTADAAYSSVIIYEAYPTSIVTAGSTWLSNNFEVVLLKAVIVEGAIALKLEQDMMGVYVNEYTQALALLKNIGDARQRGDFYRNVAPRRDAL